MEKRRKKYLTEGSEADVILRLEEKLKEKPEEEGLLLLGELYYKAGRTIDALNKFNAVLQLNPANRKAATYVTMITDVLDFYHKDLLNP